MSKHTIFACVMGDIDLLRPLGMAGIPCAVVTRPGTMPRFSRYTYASIKWNDPWKKPEKVLENLMKFGRSQAEKPILFYEHDALLKIVSRYRDQLSKAFRFVIADAALVDNILDKYKFHDLAEHVGLPVPRTRLLDANSEQDWNSVDLEYPFIIKPVTRSPALWDPVAGTAKAVLIDSPKALTRFRKQVVAAETSFELIAQQLVDGPESSIESYQVYVDQDGEIAGEFTGKKIRTYPVKLGHSCSLVTTDAEDLAKLGRELVKKLNLRGVAEFEFKRDPDGRLFLLEINPRFNLWHHLGAVAGVNLPAIVYADMAGLPRPQKVKARPGVRWCRVWQDMLSSRAEGIPFGEWLKWAKGCEVKRALAWDDPLPLLFGGIWRTSLNVSGLLMSGRSGQKLARQKQ